MTRSIYTTCITTLWLCSLAQAAPPEARLSEKHRAFFKAHCLDCHDSETREGKVDLETLSFRITTIEQAELWQKVLNALNSGEMPPEDSEQPGNTEKADFLDDLARTMVTARQALSDSGGRITMRRLNRREYRNTIEQLTSVKVDVSSLPADGGSGTFDTVGASQFISSDQFEQYLKLGRQAIDEAFERQAARSIEPRKFRVEPEETVNVKHLQSIKQMEEKYKLVKPWMDAVDKAVKAPENKAVMEQLRKEFPDIDRHPYRIYRLSRRLKGAPAPEHFGNDPDSAMNFYQLSYTDNYPSLKHYAGLPHNDRGTYLRLTGGIVRLDISPSENELPPGKYRLRFRAGIVEGSPPERHFIEVGHPQRRNQVPAGFASDPLSSHQVTGTIDNPQIIETTVEIGIDTPKEFGIQERQTKDYGARKRRHYAAKRRNGHGNPPAIWVDWIELEGPITEEAVAESTIVRVEPEKTINPSNEKAIAQIEDAYARFTRWQKGVDKAAATPENQARMARFRETDQKAAHPVWSYGFADRLEGTPNPKDFGFRDSQKAAASHPENDRANLALHKHYAALPHRDRGTYLKLAHGTGRIIVPPKKMELPPGSYVMRVRVGAVEGTPAERRFIQVGHPQRQIESRNWGLEGRAISTHQVTGTIDNPETIEIPLEVTSDTIREFAVQEKQPNNGNLKALWNAHNEWKTKNGYGHPPAIWIDWVELEGPLPKGEIAKSKIHRVEPETTINPKNENAIKGMEETHRRFAQWQRGVDEAAKTPENQAIIAEIAKTEKLILDPLRFYRFADRLKGTPDAKDFGFNDAPNASSANPKWPSTYPYLKHYANLPHRDTGAYLKPTKGTGRVIVSPEKLPLGNYTLRVRVGAVKGSDPSRHFIDVGHPQRSYTAVDFDYGLEGRAISTHQVSGTIEEPQIIEVPLEVRSDTTREFAVQEKQPNNGNMMALWKTFNAAKKKNGFGIPPAIWIDWVELEGPLSATGKRLKQRREVELHANAKVGGTYSGWFKGGHDNAKAFLETGKPQKGIADEQEAKFRIRTFEEQGPTYRRYLDDPLTKNGSFLTITPVNKEEFIALPPEHPSGWRKTKHVVETLPPGDYKLRFRIGAVEGTPSERHFVDLGAVPGKDQFNHLATFQITGSTDKPQIIEVPVQLSNNDARKFALRERRDPKTDQQRYKSAIKETGLGPVPALWIDWVEWEGPFDSPTTQSPLQAILAKHAGNPTRERGTASDTDKSPSLANASGYQEDARAILTEFAQRAFRNVSPESDFIDQLVAIYETRRKSGDSFEVAIRTPLSVILASPGFLYLYEPGDEAERRQLNDRELAVRLSYFLWSGPPDVELLQLAEQNTLHLPETLRQQVDRLIADPRADEFVSGFVHQWLDMERLDFFQFDVNLHRDFDESTRAATREEVYQSFAHLLRSPTPSSLTLRVGQSGGPDSESQATSDAGRIGKLLKSDYVFVNGLLATYYGIEGVTGDQFRKIKLPADSPRGGLLGMAAIHAMGSDGVVSSPVERGAWVLRHLLNDPPPPAPPNVPQISRLEGQILTTRERLLAHQEEAQCASCHRKIDPIGFGLENFNAAGKWRTEDSYQARDGRGRGVGKRKTWTIDASGAFHKGPAFGDYQELRDLIVEREEDFARGLTEHLIEYALGRPFGFTDEDLANEIVSSAASKEFAVSEFIHSLVQSKAFRTK